MPDKRDYYDVLGVPKTATDKEIKSAYRKIAKENHPDQHPDDKNCEAIFKEASEAYEVLSDPQKRKDYDTFGFNSPNGGFDGDFSRTYSDFSDIFGGHNPFSDFFSGFSAFGGNRGGYQPRRGQNIKTVVSISLRDAFVGIKKKVTYNHTVACEHCGGKGGEGSRTCPTCGGNGILTTRNGFFIQQTTCPNCGGKGTTVDKKCPHCGGRGYKEETTTLEVTIPQGIRNGMTLCARGKGNIGEDGKNPGDLYIEVRVESDPMFRLGGTGLFEDANLYMDLKVDPLTAIFGDEVSLPIIDTINIDKPDGNGVWNKGIKLKIPPFTQNLTSFKVKGKGFWMNNGARGDMIATVNIDIPKTITDEQREGLEKLRDSMRTINISNS